MSVYINARVGRVSEHLIRRVSRSPDWCAALFGEGRAALGNFDHHPSVPLLHKLRLTAPRSPMSSAKVPRARTSAAQQASVSTRVGNVRNNDLSQIEPVEAVRTSVIKLSKSAASVAHLIPSNN